MTPIRASKGSDGTRSGAVEAKPKRRAIPRHIRDEVLLEAGYGCANPVCRHVLTLEIHHIEWVRDGGGNDAANLIAVCPNCHSRHTAGFIPQSAFRVWKSMLTSLNAVDRMGVDHLLYLYRESQDPVAKNVMYTNDTRLLLARLFNAGLVHCRSGGAGTGLSFQYSSAWKIELTPRGQQIVEAWLSGSATALRDAMTVSDPPASE
jgi:hypothetical protein